MGVITMVKEINLDKPYDKDGKYTAKIKLVPYNEFGKPYTKSHTEEFNSRPMLSTQPIQIMGAMSDRFDYGTANILLRGAELNGNPITNMTCVAIFDKGSRRASEMQTKFRGQIIGRSKGASVKVTLPSDLKTRMQIKTGQDEHEEGSVYYTRNTKRIRNGIANNKTRKEEFKNIAKNIGSFFKFARMNNLSPVDEGGVKSYNIYGPPGTKYINGKYIGPDGKEVEVVNRTEWEKNAKKANDSGYLINSLMKYIREYL